MRVEIKIKAEVVHPYAVVYCDSVTKEVQQATKILECCDKIITAEHNNRIAVLNPDEIYMVRIENKKTIIY